MARWADLAAWHGPTPNQSGPMSEVRGVVLHIAEGSYLGTIAWQRNPSADVSSHFIKAKDDRSAQMVDTDTTAWTQASGNGHWLSIENEGRSGDKLSASQLEFAARVLARAHKVYGVPLQIATSPSGRGLGHHGMGGAAWGNHPNCPGSPIVAQKAAVVARAKAIVNGAPAPQEEDDVSPEQDRMLRNLDRIGSALINGKTEVTEFEWPAGVKKTYPLPFAAQAKAAASGVAAAETAAADALAAVRELAARPAPGTVVITDEQLERVLRKVMGSVDGPTPQG